MNRKEIEKLKSEFEDMLDQARICLEASESKEYGIKELEKGLKYFSKLEKYYWVPFLRQYYGYKCKGIKKELYKTLMETYFSLEKDLSLRVLEEIHARSKEKRGLKNGT